MKRTKGLFLLGMMVLSFMVLAGCDNGSTSGTDPTFTTAQQGTWVLVTKKLIIGETTVEYYEGETKYAEFVLLGSSPYFSDEIYTDYINVAIRCTWTDTILFVDTYDTDWGFNKAKNELYSWGGYGTFTKQ
jgi:hypothetical protein